MKNKNLEYKAKKSKTFVKEQVDEFVCIAPDAVFSAMTVRSDNAIEINTVGL